MFIGIFDEMLRASRIDSRFDGQLHALEFSDALEMTSAQPAEARVSILLYDALDFSTDHNDGGSQTRESLSRFASPSTAGAVAGLEYRTLRRSKRPTLNSDKSRAGVHGPTSN
jgi:hypothetical protein